MFEVLVRDGISRIGRWTLKDWSIKTPNILFYSSLRIQHPKEAEILISHSKIKTDKPYLFDAGSLFSQDKKLKGENVIPPDIVYPLSCNELNDELIALTKPDERNIEIVFGSEHTVKKILKNSKAELFVLGNALELVQDTKEFVKVLVSLRENAGYQKMIYAPAIGEPAHLALLSYCGIDLFDSIPLILNARDGYYLTATGRIHKDNLSEIPCPCPACLNWKDDFSHFLNHNYYSALSELKLIRTKIKIGRLREFVESRMRAEPWMVSVLRHLDLRYYNFQEQYFSITGKNFFASSKESLHRPDVRRFRERVKLRYRKPESAKILLLLPCSAKKPYSYSKSHKLFREAISVCGNQNIVHEVIVTSPLCIVPRELELFYPAQQYDIPVTGDWDSNEIYMIQNCLREFIKNNKYEHTIVHLPLEMKFVDEVLLNPIRTSDEQPTSKSALENLKEKLFKSTGKYERVLSEKRRFEDILAIARFQFGEVGEKLGAKTKIKGRYPNLRIFRDGKQIGMLTGDRGMISLTLEGAKILAGNRSYYVEIEDFKPEGNIFAVGVIDADPQIRIGDEVAVVHKNEVRAVGVAMMSPKEMIESNRGEAVRVRHKI